MSWRKLIQLLVLCSASSSGFAQNNKITLPMDPNGLAGTAFSNPTFRVFHGQVQGSGGAAAPTTYSELLFQLPNTGLNSALITVAKPPQQAGRIYVESHDSVRVGAAFSNPTSQDVALAFYFTDAQGLDSETRTLRIPANGQIVGFLNEPLFASPQDFQGTMTFYASAPVGVLAVRGTLSEGMFLMPQIPVADIGSRATGTVIVPYFWVGTAAAALEVATEMILVNPTDSTLSGTFSFIGGVSTVLPAIPPIVVSPSPSISGNSIYDYAIPPRSSVHYSATLQGAPRSGLVQVVPNSGTVAPLAFNIVAKQNQGIVQSQTTVFGQSPATAFSLLVQTTQCCGSAISNTTDTVTSLANPSGSPIVVSVMAANAQPGRTLATITVPALGQVFFDASDFAGGSIWALRFTSSSLFSMAGLQYIQLVPHGTITGPFGVEPIPDSTSPSPLLVLPHLVEGLYTSSIYAFKNWGNQSSTGELEFFSQEGAPADIAGLGRRF